MRFVETGTRRERSISGDERLEAAGEQIFEFEFDLRSEGFIEAVEPQEVKASPAPTQRATHAAC